jgi:hypothetical protein
MIKYSSHEKTIRVQLNRRRRPLRRKALKHSWLSIQICDPMKKGRSGISMNPRDNEKHEEEHEDSKKERKARTTSHYINNHKDYQA